MMLPIEEEATMEFEIELTAKTTDEGGLVGSFQSQLAELGGEAVMVSEVKPYKVGDSSGKFYFEARRTYKVTL